MSSYSYSYLRLGFCLSVFTCIVIMSSSTDSTPATTPSAGATSVDPSSVNYQAGYVAGQAVKAWSPKSTPSALVTTDNNTGLIVTGVVSGLIILLLGYYYLIRRSDLPFASRMTSFITYSIIVLLLAFGSWFIYQGVLGDKTATSNLAKVPVDSGTALVISENSVPPQSGKNGGNYGMQWWMYIKDWDTKFGENKTVITRGAKGSLNPHVYLHPTENTLVVQIDQHSSAGSSAPAVGDMFKCELKNVPLQTWFAVGLSVSGRNIDLYLDGKLLRSCLLPGVPLKPAGNIGVMSNGGFSGNVVDLYFYSRALNPADAQAFFAAGTTGTSYTANTIPSKSLFGYSVRLGITDSNGNVIKDFAV